MVLRTIVVFSILFNVYIDDTTPNIVTFCTWRFFFSLLFLGLKNLKSLPKTFEKPPITIYGDDPLPLTITPNHRVDMDGRTDIRQPPIPSVSLSSHSTAPRPLFIYFFLDNPST